MPLKRTIEKARKDKRAGKSASTQAGEFVKEQIDKIRRGIHGARNTKQAIAIGLSEARTAGVEIPDKTPGRKKKTTKAKRKASGRITKKKVSAKRSTAATQRLKKEPRSSVSKKALSTQAKKVAKSRGHASLSRSAKKAAANRRRNKS
jgi:hypothetical protein